MDTTKRLCVFLLGIIQVLYVTCTPTTVSNTTAISISWDASSYKLDIYNYTVKYDLVGASTLDNIIIIETGDLKDEQLIEISPLSPGELFKIEVYAQYKNGSNALLYTLEKATIPLPAASFTIHNVTTTTIQFYTNIDASSKQDYWDILYKDLSGGTNTEKSLNSTGPLHTLPGLLPGHWYRITAAAVSNGIRSTDNTVEQNTVPLSPVLVAVSAVNTTFVSLQWEPGTDSLQDTYEVTYEGVTTCSGPSTTCLIDTSSSAVFPPGYLFTFNVYSIKDAQRSSPLQVQHSTKPIPPSNITIVTNSKTSLTVSWDEPQAEFQTYTISVSPSVTITTASVAKGSTRETVLSDLVAGQHYLVSIVTVSGSEESAAYSRSYTTEPPAAKNLKSVSSKERALDLQWEAPTEADGNFDRFKVNLMPADGATYPIYVNSSMPNITLEDLIPGKLYTVSVLTISGEVESQPLSQQFRTVPLPVRSDSIFRQNYTTESVTFTWTGNPSSDPNSAVHDDIYAATLLTSGGEIQAQKNISGDRIVTFDGLSAASQYTFQISVYSGELESSIQNRTALTAPNPPRNFKIDSVTSTTISVSWDAPISGDFTYYHIWLFYAGTPSIVQNENTTLQTLQFKNLTPGNRYGITMNTYLQRDQYLFTGSEFLTLTNITTIPLPINDLREDPGKTSTTSLGVTWKPPHNIYYSAFKLQLLHGLTEIATAITDDLTLMHQFTDLVPGRTYTVNVLVLRYDAESSIISGSFTTIPIPPGELLVNHVSQSEARLGWVIPTSDYESYKLTVRKLPDSTLEQIISIPDKATQLYTVKRLLTGTQYEIELKTVSKDKSSESVMAVIETLPPTVTALQILNVTETTIEVRWIAPEGGDITKYKLEIDHLGQDKKESFEFEKDAELQYTFTGLLPGRSYNITIETLSSNQTSAPNNDVLTTKPLPIYNLQTNAYNTSAIQLSWDVNASSVQDIFRILYNEESENITTDMVSVEWTPGQYSYQAALTNLLAGQRYHILVKASSQDVLSSPIWAYQNVVPVCDLILNEDTSASTTNSITLEYTQNSGVFDKIIFTTNPASRNFERSSTDEKTVTLTGLNAGTYYTVNTEVVSNTETSQPCQPYSVNTNPHQIDPPTLVVLNQSITVTWQHPNGTVDRYLVKCIGKNGELCSPQEQNITDFSLNAPVTLEYGGLQPNTEYLFRVIAYLGEKSSSERIISTSTDEAAPGSPREFNVKELKPNEVELTWLPPTQLNGELKDYHISYTGESADKASTSTGSASPEAGDTKIILSQLRAGYMYTFTLSANTKYRGPAATVRITLSIDIPATAIPLTESKPSKVEDTSSHDTLSVNFINPFNEDNGEITGYSVIVTEDSSIPIGNGTLPKYQDIKSKAIWPPYQATAPCKDFFEPTSTCGGNTVLSARKRRSTGESKTFVVGGETCSNEDYCNGPLKPNTDYYVRLRAYTEAGHTDTLYSSPMKTAVRPTTQSNVALIAGLVVAMVLILAIVLILLFLLRRRGIICKGDGKKGSEPPLSLSGLGSQRQTDRFASSRPVPLDQLVEHIRLLSKDSDFGYSEEYEDLKQVGRDQPTSAAELPVNRAKNRFTNILPYDHSRVKLLPTDDEEGSDYINANYMPGHTSKREFIVTQGPLAATKDDFWRMVWEQNCKAIVMLTKCIEKGRERCDHYWPNDSDPCFYGDLQVVILNETHCTEWTISEFKISLGATSRNIKHFHYTAWPDFGVPQRPQSLIKFVRIVREKLLSTNIEGPIVVHCSAGVGRSGTYICVDRLLQHIKTSNEADIFGYVHEMRRHRVWMVQTEQQYICIHQCVECVLEGKDKDPVSVPLGQENPAFEVKKNHIKDQAYFPLQNDEGITVESSDTN
ncbi:unnamed protein product [Owenia fusiformis]|uniref:protein-tyrosine-phosphatase n=1 Tax=Owenia fusiformis TaxID=6347 RepID=A0A8J1XIP7_OWEFU|nr:unnamed protein product [Owenia fusiformis]